MISPREIFRRSSPAVCGRTKKPRKWLWLTLVVLVVLGVVAAARAVGRQQL